MTLLLLLILSRFRWSDLPPNLGAVWNPPPCNHRDPCDWNGDGAIDSRDWHDFLAQFFAGNADWDGDGRTDEADFAGMLICTGGRP